MLCCGYSTVLIMLSLFEIYYYVYCLVPHSGEWKTITSLHPTQYFSKPIYVPAVT